MQAAPPIPTRAPFQSNTLGGSLDETSSCHGPVLYTQLQKRRAKQRAPTPTNENADPDGPKSLPGTHLSTQTTRATGGASMAPGIVYSELSLENCRSRSLPLLDCGSGEAHSFRLSVPSFTPPQLSPDPSNNGTDRTCSLGDRRLGVRPSSGSGDSLESPLYQLAGMPHDTLAGPRSTHGQAQALARIPTPPQDEDEYAEVPYEPLDCHLLSDNTYEMIPDQGFNSSPFHDNTYEMIPEQGLKNEACHASTAHSRTYRPFRNQQPKHVDTDWSLKVSPANIFQSFFYETQ